MSVYRLRSTRIKRLYFYLGEQALEPVIRNSSNEVAHHLAIYEDITARRHLEQQLHQAQKMESIGRRFSGFTRELKGGTLIITYMLRKTHGIDWFIGWIVLGLLVFLSTTWAQVAEPRFEVRILNPVQSEIALTSVVQSNTVLILEASTNLTTWQPVGLFHDAVLDYPDLGIGNRSSRFYRVSATHRRPDDDWKNQIVFPIEPFLSTNTLEDIGWVKFAILLSDPTRVYYQDSGKYPFHYQFATRRLAPFMGMTASTFEEVALHRNQQQVVLGTVLYPPGSGWLTSWMGGYFEIGVQFDGLDPYTPEEIAQWFALVKATVFPSTPITLFYMPTFEQSAVAYAHADEFAARGISVSSADRWTMANYCYAPGWAMGQLRYFPGSQIVAAFGDGRLRSEDILLTDGVPADMPVVAGLISLKPSTPNSHTAILARSLGLPFAYLSEESQRERAQALIGHQIILRAMAKPGPNQIKIIDVEGALEPALESEMLALRARTPIAFSPKQTLGSIWASTDGLEPSDTQYFGGKAANYGLLRRWIPTNCPVAIAFSFDLWDEFIDQSLPGGLALRAEIARRLAPFTNYPPNMISLRNTLAAIRDLFTRTAVFSAAQQQRIIEALAGFNPHRNLRFRSSTNLEDTEHFTGAGLYDSYSGCLSDDLDGDGSGPCQCEPDTSQERGVFRALRKVYASFYNEDAVLQRLLYRVDESQVGMGVLVHHSFPDAEELANGVATLRYNYSQGSVTYTGDLVTQLGAESVTNPDGNSLPEVVALSPYDGLTQQQGSSLLPLGGWVMDWPADYWSFLDLFSRVAQGFYQLNPARNSFSLDFEYKKDAGLGLVVKQVRPLPQPAASSPVTAFLIDEPVACVVAQYGSVFANHRLKSVWLLRSPSMRLTTSNLIQGVYGPCSLEYIENGVLQHLSGPMNSWPNASVTPDGSTNRWTTGDGAGQRSWALETALQTTATGSVPPIFTLADFPRNITVRYDKPVPRIFGETLTYVMDDKVELMCRMDDESSALWNERLLVKTNVITIQTSYYWPKPPEGGVLAVSTPLLRFVETRISGLTTQPIVLTNYYSQSYGAFIHNYIEQFLFEPCLEPGLPQATRDELEAANIQLIFASTIGGQGQKGLFYVMGFDQSLRQL